MEPDQLVKGRKKALDGTVGWYCKGEAKKECNRIYAAIYWRKLHPDAKPREVARRHRRGLEKKQIRCKECGKELPNEEQEAGVVMCKNCWYKLVNPEKGGRWQKGYCIKCRTFGRVNQDKYCPYCEERRK